MSVRFIWLWCNLKPKSFADFREVWMIYLLLRIGYWSPHYHHISPCLCLYVCFMKLDTSIFSTYRPSWWTVPLLIFSHIHIHHRAGQASVGWPGKCCWHWSCVHFRSSLLCDHKLLLASKSFEPGAWADFCWVQSPQPQSVYPWAVYPQAEEYPSGR
jgi:hypothetical protein